VATGDRRPQAARVYAKERKYDATSLQARMAKANSQFMNVMNGAGVCLFGAFLGIHRIRIFDWLNAATGWHLTPDEYMDAGARIQTLKQAFNIKHGIRPKDFVVRGRPLGHPPMTHGANKDRSVDIDTLMAGYWALLAGIRKPGIRLTPRSQISRQGFDPGEDSWLFSLLNAATVARPAGRSAPPMPYPEKKHSSTGFLTRPVSTAGPAAGSVLPEPWSMPLAGRFQKSQKTMGSSPV
jgi:hypothetical protein